MLDGPLTPDEMADLEWDSGFSAYEQQLEAELAEMESAARRLNRLAAAKTATRKCARCGHPYNKHTHKPNRGCTVSYRKGRYRSFRLCPCPSFREEGA